MDVRHFINAVRQTTAGSRRKNKMSFYCSVPVRVVAPLWVWMFEYPFQSPMELYLTLLSLSV